MLSSRNPDGKLLSAKFAEEQERARVAYLTLAPWEIEYYDLIPAGTGIDLLQAARFDHDHYVFQSSPVDWRTPTRDLHMRAFKLIGGSS